jgi:hypothetical protein
LLLAVFLSAGAHAQKGTGDVDGVARWSVKPDLVPISGVVKETRTHACEDTTGGAVAGTHVILKTDDGCLVNVHLGPVVAVACVADQLTAGRKVDVIGFRTSKMLAGHYVAKSLVFGNALFVLRDDALRPYWSVSSLSSGLRTGDHRADGLRYRPERRSRLEPRSGRGRWRGSGFGRYHRGRQRLRGFRAGPQASGPAVNARGGSNSLSPAAGGRMANRPFSSRRPAPRTASTPDSSPAGFAASGR